MEIAKRKERKKKERRKTVQLCNSCQKEETCTYNRRNLF